MISYIIAVTVATGNELFRQGSTQIPMSVLTVHILRTRQIPALMHLGRNSPEPSENLVLLGKAALIHQREISRQAGGSLSKLNT